MNTRERVQLPHHLLLHHIINFPNNIASVTYNPSDNMEKQRLTDAREQTAPWKKWGPYLSDRQWGTVREDYSKNGDA